MDTLIISLLSQKGGVCKSFLSKLIGVELARLGFKVLIADMDVSQRTSTRWGVTRKKKGIEPSIEVHPFSTVDGATSQVGHHHFIIFDGLPSTGDEKTAEKTRAMARLSNLIIIPFSSSKEDIDPQVELAHELVDRGLEKERILFCMAKVSDSVSTNRNAMQYVSQAGYAIIPHTIPFRTTLQSIALEGRAGTETKYDKLNKRCEQVVQWIANYMDL